MKRIISFLLFVLSLAAAAQTTTFTANLKDLATNTPTNPEAGPVYIELTLRNIGTAVTPTLCRVNGTGVVSFPVNLYPVLGVVTATVYDETFISCGGSTGVSYYHVRVYQGDSTRSAIKKLLFEDDFDIEGATFNLNSTAPRSAGVITPPPATAVLTNPSGSQTVVQPGGTVLSVNHFSATFGQASNGADMIPANRFTDTSPTGNFLNFKNAANSTSLWQVDVTGALLAGSIPTGRLSGTVGIAAGGTGQATASAAFNALSPITTLGDIIYGNGANSATNLAGNTTSTKKYLSQTGTGTVSAAPAWAQIAFGDISGVGSCSQEPALTGDVTSSSGSCATTVAKINGTSVGTPTGTAGSAVVLATSPSITSASLTTPTIGSAGATLSGSSSGSTVVKASATASGTLTLPAATATLAIGTLNKQIFTTSGTFTIPTAVISVKVTLCGGGGAGGGATGTNNGGGGGSGGSAIKYLSGLTPGNTITVTVGSGGSGVSGAAGGSGTASSIASGTQTITTVTANGGSGGNSNAAQSAGGAGAAISTNGDLNFGGNPGSGDWSSISGAAGGASLFGGAGADSNGGNPGVAATANSCSGGGGAGSGATRTGGNGAAGLVIFEWTT